MTERKETGSGRVADCTYLLHGRKEMSQDRVKQNEKKDGTGQQQGYSGTVFEPGQSKTDGHSGWVGVGRH